jgi:hypothetical protein
MLEDLVLLLCLVQVLFPVADAAKLRSWLDSSMSLMEGDLPSPRYGHGFASTQPEDGNMYVFGGQGLTGK